MRGGRPCSAEHWRRSMTHAAETHSPRRAHARHLPLVLASAGLALATVAQAGPVSPDHRFEHIGRSVSDVASIVPYAGRGRMLVLEHTGDIRLVSGDGLVNDLRTHLN